MFLYTMHIVGINLYRRKMDGIESSYESLIDRKKELEQQVNFDELTKLYNRTFIHNKLDELCLNKEEFGLLYVDVNRLKFVNDTYGHKYGNRYLKQVAQGIERGIRETDYAARIGGDEFLVILCKLDESNLPLVIQRIKSCLDEFDLIDGIAISASIGGIWVDGPLKLMGKKFILEQADYYMRSEKEKYYKQEGNKI